MKNNVPPASPARPSPDPGAEPGGKRCCGRSCLQERPKTPKDGPKTAQGPQTTPDGPKRPQTAPEGPEKSMKNYWFFMVLS